MKNDNWSGKSILKGTTNNLIVSRATINGVILGVVIGTAAEPLGPLIGSGIGVLIGALTGFKFKNLLPLNW